MWREKTYHEILNLTLNIIPCVVVVTIGIFKVIEVEGNINQLLKMGGNFLLTYLLMKRQLSILILSESFTIFDLKMREAVQTLPYLKRINLAYILSPHNTCIICDSNRA